jgi:hypothetical protein
MVSRGFDVTQVAIELFHIKLWHQFTRFSPGLGRNAAGLRRGICISEIASHYFNCAAAYAQRGAISYLHDIYWFKANETSQRFCCGCCCYCNFF